MRTNSKEGGGLGSREILLTPDNVHRRTREKPTMGLAGRTWQMLIINFVAKSVLCCNWSLSLKGGALVSKCTPTPTPTLPPPSCDIKDFA